MENQLIKYINPELVALAAVLAAAGGLLKKSSLIADKWIPLLLGIGGILLAFFWYLAENPPQNGASWLAAVFSGVGQGVLCAAAAVYGHQLVKQSGKKE